MNYNNIKFLGLIILYSLVLVSCRSCSTGNPVSQAGDGPEITIYEPVQGDSRGLSVVPSKVNNEQIIVSGKISDKNGVKLTIDINNIEYRINYKDKSFREEIDMPLNGKIIIKAWDRRNNLSKIVINVKKNPIQELIPNYKLAYIIGNSDYLNNIRSLSNPVNDANSMGDVLKKLGFRVKILVNQDKSSLINSIDQFSHNILSRGVKLFYYAGHGMQIDGENFLIPIDAENTQNIDEFKEQCISLNVLMSALKRDNDNLNIIIIDACRDNPFLNSEFEGYSVGLAPISSPPPGTIIVFAADANQAAIDGDGNGYNSIYTTALLENIIIPNITFEDVFKRTRIDVIKKSKSKQEPVDYNKLVMSFYFLKTN